MSQKDLFPETLIGQTQSLVQDTHVSRSALQANKKGPKTLATSGPLYIKSLHSKDPLTVFLKMFLVTLRWDSTKFSLTWKMKNTPARRSIYQLTRLVLPTKENASGSSASLWATPNTFDYLPQRSKEATLKMQNGHRKCRTRPSNLREQVDEETMKMWPTPDANMGERGTQPNWTKTRPSGHHAQYTLNQAVRDNPIMWPTPIVGCVEGGEQSSRVEKTNSGSYIIRKKNKPHMTYGAKLSDAILFEEKQKMWPTPTANEDAAGRPNGKMQRMLGNDPNIRGKTPKEWEKGSLNPDWVEWLMGYDRGWTDLDCNNPQPHDSFQKEPEDIPRVAKGKKDRAKRLKGLGNAVLPQIPMQIALAIKKTREVELCKNVKKKDVKTKQI